MHTRCMVEGGLDLGHLGPHLGEVLDLRVLHSIGQGRDGGCQCTHDVWWGGMVWGVVGVIFVFCTGQDRQEGVAANAHTTCGGGGGGGG